jgi:hypothetical protein
MDSKRPSYLNLIGIIWILLSPILFLMALISTVESALVYQIQVICFGIISTIGIISGIGILLLRKWACYLLRVVSGIGFIYFVGAAFLMIIYSVFGMVKGNISSFIGIPFAFGVAVFSVPFYFMVKKLNAIYQELR